MNKIALMSVVLGAAVASNANASYCLDNYYTTVNLGVALTANRLGKTQENLLKSLVPGDKYEHHKKAGFTGDIRFGRDWTLGKSCFTAGLFIGVGGGAGSNKVKTDDPQFVNRNLSTELGVAEDSKYALKINKTTGIYFPLGLRLGYTICGTLLYIAGGYAPSHVKNKFDAYLVDQKDVLLGTEQKTSKKWINTGFFELGFQTPVSNNVSLGMSASVYAGSVKLSKKVYDNLEAKINKRVPTADKLENKSALYRQIRLFASFTYRMPVR